MKENVWKWMVKNNASVSQASKHFKMKICNVWEQINKERKK